MVPPHLGMYDQVPGQDIDSGWAGVILHLPRSKIPPPHVSSSSSLPEVANQRLGHGNNFSADRAILVSHLLSMGPELLTLSILNVNTNVTGWQSIITANSLTNAGTVHHVSKCPTTSRHITADQEFINRVPIYTSIYIASNAGHFFDHKWIDIYAPVYLFVNAPQFLDPKWIDITVLRRFLAQIHPQHTHLCHVTSFKLKLNLPQPQSNRKLGIKEEINANISSFLAPEIKPPPKCINGLLTGNVLMVDGVALETKCRYCLYRDAIIGLCREHSHCVNTKVDSLESVEKVRVALAKDIKDSGKVCFGSDATVVAIAPYAESENYTPVPIVVSPSDKTEKGASHAEWVQVVLDAWDSHPHGKTLHGPIKAIASDGDAAFRLAKHLICMTTAVDPESPLGKIVCGLIGLNCYTSAHGLRSTCDPKHILKCDATLTQSPSGVMIARTDIQPNDVVQNLSDLPEISRPQAQELLNPGDKQNVPKAATLIQRMRQLETLSLPRSPSDVQIRNTIIFYGQVLSDFLFPFITVEYSLSEQVKSLSTYAFLAAALQIKHGSACLTGPLYSDSQAVVKNIISIIAEMQLISPDLEFYIVLEGTDQLEDQGHRRLNLTGALGIDHINPKSWKGNVQVGDVDLKKEWEAGMNLASRLLQKYFGAADRRDFCQIFSQPNHDLCCPTGNYENQTTDGHSSGEDLLPWMSQEEIQLHHNDIPDQNFQDMPLGMDLDQFFPDGPLDEESPTNETPIAFSKFLMVEGKKYLKSSLVASLSSNRSKKATMRTLHIRGVALEDLYNRQSEDFDPGDLDVDDLLKAGDLVATLMHTGEKICLGILLVKGIRVGKDKSIQTAASLTDLEDQNFDGVVVCQIMEMENPLGKDTSPADFWEWTGNYLCLDMESPDSRDMRKQFVIDIPAQLTEVMEHVWQLLDPELIEIAANVAQLLEVANPEFLPYCDAIGKPSLVVNNVPAHLRQVKLKANDKIPCGVTKKLSAMQNHVGGHILFSRWDISEEGLIKSVGLGPCGFCGLDGCFTQLINLTHPKKPMSIKSSCPYHYS
ncbi:hypothetical protein DFH08DRAFT_822155 [Mycena albidolilacea]|uniref:Uncharacterized protein n=1 Tax=Mycena albidolilacea TaxID=1033008 RepID=A0AAD7ECF0_9AGAR|nr:hypothetical protein DFH08DRAFT_822155 [Mycena albidolilacea]